VKRWHYSEQRQQWTALLLLEAEREMRRIDGYKHLSQIARSPPRNHPDIAADGTSFPPLFN
jgi:hypothetical protein